MSLNDSTYNNGRGFTLLELLVAIAISTVGILGFAAGTTSVIKGNQANHFTSVANALAQDKIEELKANPATLSSGGPVSSAISGQTFTTSWSVTANSPIAGMHKIDVTVTWTDYQSHTITLASAVHW